MRSARATAVLLAVLSLALIATATPAGAGLLSPPTAPASWTLGGAPCDLIEVPAAQTAAPIGTGTCAGTRPGGIVVSDLGMCTLNFLFKGSDGKRYIGTAGHCIIGGGERSWAAGKGPVARNGSGSRIGEFAYAVLQDPKDFALIRLDAGTSASPEVCHFGGPTGTNSSRPTGPEVLHYFGNGNVIGAIVPGRSAVAFGMPHPDHVYAQGAVVPGDSGSAILSADGRAVGVVVTTGVHAGGGAGAGLIGITRIGPQVARARQVLGVTLTLQTAAQH